MIRIIKLLVVLMLSMSWGIAQNLTPLDSTLNQVYMNTLNNIPKDTLNNVLKGTLNNALSNALNSTSYSQLSDQGKVALQNHLNSLIDNQSFNLLRDTLSRELDALGIQVPSSMLNDALTNSFNNALKETLENALRNDPSNMLIHSLINSLPITPIDINAQISALTTGLTDIANTALGNIDMGKFNQALEEINEHLAEMIANPLIALNIVWIKKFMEMMSELFNLLGFDFAWPCTDNTESVTSQQEKKTKQMLSEEEKRLKDAIADYKEALQKKREMMMILWKTTKEIEFVMKENHILRKRIMKHWENVRHSPSDVHSF